MAAGAGSWLTSMVDGGGLQLALMAHGGAVLLRHRGWWMNGVAAMVSAQVQMRVRELCGG